MQKVQIESAAPDNLHFLHNLHFALCG